MGIVDLAFIRVESSFPLRKPEYIYIKTELNHHGSCKVQAVIDEDIYNENLDMILKIEDFKIIYEPDQKEYIFAFFLQGDCHRAMLRGIFQGIVQQNGE